LKFRTLKSFSKQAIVNIKKKLGSTVRIPPKQLESNESEFEDFWGAKNPTPDIGICYSKEIKFFTGSTFTIFKSQIVRRFSGFFAMII
jgi:hypothetical protein